ncbi:hypothetical protein K438DRAFT_1777849 [Mycena galopus ATCC 62051]|nr:hypothetical protein K438DRAFT_1777849 [Mycena galopus ATCC 62051]
MNPQDATIIEPETTQAAGSHPTLHRHVHMPPAHAATPPPFPTLTKIARKKAIHPPLRDSALPPPCVFERREMTAARRSRRVGVCAKSVVVDDPDLRGGRERRKTKKKNDDKMEENQVHASHILDVLPAARQKVEVDLSEKGNLQTSKKEIDGYSQESREKRDT